MSKYREMYYVLFDAQVRAIGILQKALEKAEEIYCDDDTDDIPKQKLRIIQDEPKGHE